MNKLTLSTLLILFSAAIVAPAVKAEKTSESPATETRTEELQQEIEDPLKTEESLEDFEEEAEGEPQTRTEDIEESVEEDSSSSLETDAFEFVTSAYQGQYEEQGIPGFDQLFSAYTTGELTAEKLVMVGVEKGILDSKMMDDEAYINAVELQLESLENN